MPANEISPEHLGCLTAGLPASEYFAAPGINQSGLKAILHSPARYRWQLSHRSKSSLAAELGTDVHTAILEPERFAAEVFVQPPFARAKGQTITSQVADWASSLPATHRIVTEAHMAKVSGMRDAVLANPKARRLLSGGQAEGSLWWHDPVYDVLCKARADYVSPFAGGCVVDIKTSQSATEQDFSRSVVDAKLRYDLQAAHYLAAGEQTGAYRPDIFFFVVVSSSEPYECVVYEASPEVIAFGRKWREHAMALYADCMATGAWDPLPDYALLGLPPWAKEPV